MVKNTTGGTGTKGLARKHQTMDDDTDSSHIRLPTCDLEQIVVITKMLGNGMCEVYNNDDVRYIAHIRNKFRGKNKRHHLFTSNMLVLVGLREWENPKINCDILSSFDHSSIPSLSSFPSISIHNLLKRIEHF